VKFVLFADMFLEHFQNRDGSGRSKKLDKKLLKNQNFCQKTKPVLRAGSTPVPKQGNL
jgi:hypothetical protein